MIYAMSKEVTQPAEATAANEVFTTSKQVFRTDNIAMRHGFNRGFDGLELAKRVLVKPHDQVFLSKRPDVNTQAPPAPKIEFEASDMARQEFLASKPNLAGKRNVSSYEDRSTGDASLAVFDPLKDKTQKKAGSYSYNSGRHQGGESGETFMRVNKVYRGGRPVTLEKQDPFLPKLSTSIKIRS